MPNQTHRQKKNLQAVFALPLQPNGALQNYSMLRPSLDFGILSVLLVYIEHIVIHSVQKELNNT